MDIEAELKLSFYQRIATLNEEHGVDIVQHIETRKVYVQKNLKIYDRKVYEYIKANPLPGIPRIIEVVESDHHLSIIEEYVSGQSLREVMDERGPLPLDFVLTCARQLCEVLRPLHNLTPPVVHRDIKPSNILLTSAGQLYLVDLNAAKETERAKERDTVLIGTFGYAAPEQYGFSPSMPTADIYAIGVLLNEMLTGSPPQREMCSGPLCGVIQKCIQMEPSLRFRSVDELLAAIDTAIPKPKPKRTEQGWKSWLPPGFRRRKPFAMVLSSFWYVSIVIASFAAVLDGVGQPRLTIYRIILLAFFLGETLWLLNYRHIWSTFPISNNRYKLVRWFGVGLWAFLFMVGVVIIYGIVVGSQA